MRFITGTRRLPWINAAMTFCLASMFTQGVVGTAGCVTPAQRRRADLPRIARTYNNDLRWARYEVASTRMPKQEGQRFLKRASLLEDELEIADHEVVSVTFEDSSGEAAQVVVRFEWYLKREPVVRRTYILQSWKFDDGAWQVKDQRRSRGERLGLFLEAPTEDPTQNKVPIDNAKAPSRGDDSDSPRSDALTH